MIDGVVAPVFHNIEPAELVVTADIIEFPQLLVTVIPGFNGVFFGAAVPLPGVLVQPLAVEVTVYTP